MNHKFDELTKGLAQSVTRRAALKKFGAGLAGMALACFGLANKAEAGTPCIPRGTLCCYQYPGKTHCNEKYCKSLCCSGKSYCTGVACSCL